MAVAYRSHTTLPSANGVTTRTITKPTGVVVGDLLILHYANATDAAPSALPGGFVAVANGIVAGANGIWLYQKTATGSEPADYSVSVNSSHTTTLGLVAFSTDSGLAIAVDISANQTNAASTNRVWPAVTTTVANTLLACFGSLAGNNTTTPANGMTERWDTGVPKIYMMHQAVASAGDTGTRTATGSSAVVSNCVTVALKESAVVAIPAAPSGLVATAVSTSQINLAWTDNSSNEDQFEVEMSNDGITGWSLIATPLANATSYSNVSLNPATQYFYRLRASNSAGNSDYTSVSSATTDSEIPTAPTGLTATAVSSSQINLTWTDTSNVETGFEVQRSPNGATGWTLLTTTAASAQSYNDTGLTDGTAYHYRVRAINASGSSAYTAVATDTTPLIAPTGLTAVGASASSISLSWQDNSGAETGYKIEQSSNGVTGWTVIYTTAANTTTHLVTGLPENTERFFRVRAFRDLTVTIYSAYTSTASAYTLLLGHAPIEPRLYLHNPQVALAARVNQPIAAEYPIEFVVYDGVTAGSLGAIKPGMTVMIGTTPGGDQLGRQRVRSVNGAGATSIVIWVGRSSRGSHDGELILTDNAYITVLEEYRVWAKTPYIDPEGGIFKDGHLDVEEWTTNPPPVANCGAGFAATINATTSLIQVLFNGQSSFAVADGATITTFAWNIKDGTLTAGTLASNNITATFGPGFRYVELTVTDSNGNSHRAVCPVYARDPANDTSFAEFDIDSHRFTEAGQTMSISILADMPRATYFDGCLAMIWEREPSGTADRDHMLINGWLDTENATIGAGRTGLMRDTTLTILDVAARLDMLPGFPQSLADDSTRDVTKTPDITWNYMVNPNLDKYLHYLLHWHSTALEVADFTWSGAGAAYPFVLLNSDGQSLWSQVDQRARAFVPDYVLTCDRRGRIAVVPDPQLRDPADRTNVILAAIDEDDWSDLRLAYQRSPRIHWLDGNAILAGSTTPIGTVFSLAPGEAPGQGVGATTQGEKLALSQADLNSATGHRYARINAPVTALTLTLVQDDNGAASSVPWREIEPAYKQWVTLTMSAETAAQRGLTYNAVRCLPKEINIRYNQTRTGLTRTVELTLEPETAGEPGVTVVKPNVPAVGVQPERPPAPLETTPPSMGLISGQQLVAGIGEGALYRTSDFQTTSGAGGPTWAEVNLTGSEKILSWVVDPFSPGYINGVGAVNGWVATAEKIYRVGDIFGTVSCTAVHTFPVALSASTHWRSIQASFGAYFPAGVNPWLLCISYYGSTGGHTGTWATRSLDGGVTWQTETLVSSFYDSALSTVNPIGVYTSPKTPGLAYTAAYTVTAAPAESIGYVSTDWGETWSAMNAFVEDPNEPMPHWTVLREDGSLSATYAGGQFNYYHLVKSLNGAGLVTNGPNNVLFAPPENAVRVKLAGSYFHEKRQVTTGGNNAGFYQAYSLAKPAALSVTQNLNFVQAPINGSWAGVYTVEWTRLSGTVWPGNRDQLLSTPPTSPSGYARWFVDSSVQTIFNWDAIQILDHTATVIEIELSNGHIYTPPASVGSILPVHGAAGQIHLPWPDNDNEALIYYGSIDRTGNRQIRLKRAVGLDIVDISPTASGTAFGVNHGHFAVRAHDSNRQLVLAGVTGNDASSSTSGDKQALFVSSNAGDTWSQVIAPVTSTQPYSAAWGGSLDGSVFIWGPAAYFGYSADTGVSVDSRAGNLAALSATILRGIAGGIS